MIKPIYNTKRNKIVDVYSIEGAFTKQSPGGGFGLVLLTKGGHLIDMEHAETEEAISRKMSEFVEKWVNLCQ